MTKEQVIEILKGLLMEYMDQTREPVKVLLHKHISEFERGCTGAHSKIQKSTWGLGLHTLEVVRKSLELNQEFDEIDLIETCLIHDLRTWKEFPLKDHQVTAIRATKGLSWEIWRHQEMFRFTALILVADMWSAYVNVDTKIQAVIDRLKHGQD